MQGRNGSFGKQVCTVRCPMYATCSFDQSFWCNLSANGNRI